MSDPAIINWHRIDDRLTTSGQPTEAQLADIRAAGAQHVINLALHTHEQALPDEAASVAALGMTYTHIPVEFAAPTPADFAKFCSAMDALGGAPVHVHCIMNWRVSAFVYRYRRDVTGADPAVARADLDRIWQPDPVWAAFIAAPATAAPAGTAP